jgi:hypothetical protein
VTDAKQFSAFSGLPAEIHNEAGGAFKGFGGQITGRMTELLPGKKNRPDVACRYVARRR